MPGLAPETQFNRSAHVIDPTEGAMKALSNVRGLLGDYVQQDQFAKKMAEEKRQSDLNEAYRQQQQKLAQDEFGIMQDKWAKEQADAAIRDYTGSEVGRLLTLKPEEIRREYKNLLKNAGGFAPSPQEQELIQKGMETKTAEYDKPDMYRVGKDGSIEQFKPRNVAEEHSFLKKGYNYGVYTRPYKDSDGTDKDKDKSNSLFSTSNEAKGLITAMNDSSIWANANTEQRRQVLDAGDAMKKAFGLKDNEINNVMSMNLESWSPGTNALDTKGFKQYLEGKNLRVKVGEGDKAYAKDIPAYTGIIGLTAKDDKGESAYNATFDAGKTILVRNPKFNTEAKSYTSSLMPGVKLYYDKTNNIVQPENTPIGQPKNKVLPDYKKAQEMYYGGMGYTP